MKMKYGSPNILEEATGEITLTISQLAELGVGEVQALEWQSFWEEHQEFISDTYPNFNVNDTSTWPSFFNLANPDTWLDLLF